MEQRPASGPNRRSPIDAMIGALRGDKGLSPQEQALLNSVSVEFGLSETDPLWLVILPALFRKETDVIAEVRELFAELMRNGVNAGISGQLMELNEALQEERASVNLLVTRLDKAVERAMIAAAARLDLKGGGASINHDAPARASAPSARWLGIAAAFAALSFLAGVYINKAPYEKRIAQLEAKVEVCSHALAGKNNKK